MSNFEVPEPILNSPYDEPREHWWIIEGQPLERRSGRRPAMYYYREPGRDQYFIGDENGEFINQLRVYALLALYLLDARGERGAIVKTLSTTNMLNKLGKLYDVPVYETGVGFKYVAPKMMETDALIGGEESGGYAFRNNVPERDGILAGLYLLDLMNKPRYPVYLRFLDKLARLGRKLGRRKTMS